MSYTVCVISPPAKYPAPCPMFSSLPILCITGTLVFLLFLQMSTCSYLAIFPTWNAPPSDGGMAYPCHGLTSSCFPTIHHLFRKASLASLKCLSYSLYPTLFFIHISTSTWQYRVYIDLLIVYLPCWQNPHKQWLSLLFSLHYLQGLIGSMHTVLN